MIPSHRPPPIPQGGILRYFVGHGTAANLVLMLMVIAGIVAGTKIRAQFFPDVVIESITVRIPWSGAGAMEIDNAIVARAEPVLRAVEGVEEITTVARENIATFTIDFNAGWDMSQAMEDVKTQLATVRDLPEDAEDPVITMSRFWDPVTDVLIAGPVPVTLLERYAEELKARLFKQGITKVFIRGVAKPQIIIEPQLDAMERYGLTLQDLATAIGSHSGTQPIGEIGGGAIRVRAGGTKETVRDLGALSVRARTDGSVLELRDVARVYEEKLDREVAYYSKGVPAILINVQRDADGDAIGIQKMVREQADLLAPTLPDGVGINLVHTRAEAISERLDILVNNGLTGLAIVLVLLFLFLSARTAFWVAVGIPVAMAATIAFMYGIGMSINMLSLFALIICLGIVVDDAIVVGEHADHLSRHYGFMPMDAAATAAQRMAAPVFSASVTTVIAFASLIAIGGRFGKFMEAMPIIVSVVIIASLVESFFVLPNHMRHSLAAGHRKMHWYDWPSHFVNRGFSWFRDRIVRPFTYWVIRLRYPVLAGAIMALLLSINAIVDGTVSWRFFSAPERGTLVANIAMLPGATRAETKAMLDEMERALNVVNARLEQEHGKAPVVIALAKLGGASGRRFRPGETKDPDQLGSFDIELIDPDSRPYSAFDFIDIWREEIKDHPMLEVLAVRGQRHGPGGDDIDVRLSGGEIETLKAAAEFIKLELARFSAVSGVEDSLAYDKPEHVISLKPKGLALGFTSADVARQLRQQLDGTVATTFAREGREVEVEVRLSDKAAPVSYLHKAMVKSTAGHFVPLTDIATVEEVQGFSAVRRFDGDRVVSVTGDLSDDVEAGKQVIEALSGQILPEVAARYSVDWHLSGMAEQEESFLSDAAFGFGLCLIGIYLVLAWVFGSWLRPLSVMLIIPFGLVGMVWGHYLMDSPLTIFSVVGFIGMAGIIVNDSIVLVTTIEEYRKHQDTVTAVINGVADRLRAVLLTTMTTVGGLIPLLMEKSIQAQFLKPTVITLAFGLGLGVVIVLMVTPSLVMMQRDIGAILTSLRRVPKALWRRRPSAAT